MSKGRCLDREAKEVQMSSWRRRAFIARLTPAALAATVLIAGGQPALAATQLSQTGTVGPHSIKDTASSPGVTCDYQHKSPGSFGKLVFIVVGRPKMRAVTGWTNQIVGWKFTVQRRTVSEGGPGPWQNRYTSKEQTSPASENTNATFSNRGVQVITGPPMTGASYQYRVLMTMFWHLGDGSVQGKVKERIDFYEDSENTGPTAEQDHECDAWVSFS
jgi:hypothetical protein